MSARVPIGDLVDHDHRLYSFERTSGLRAEDFEPDRWVTAGDRFVLAVCAVAAVIAVLLIVEVI